jgi:rhodanese-related sulfurtransferase
MFKIKGIIITAVLTVFSGFLFNTISASGISYTYKKEPLENNKVLSLNETKKIHDNQSALFIDARPKPAYLRKHIANAINVSYRSHEKEKLMNGIAKDENIVVYCYSKRCSQARILQRELIKLGYNHVALFEEGISVWEKSNYPVESK